MTIFHQYGNIYRNSDGLSRWALENKGENPEWVPQEDNHIKAIFVTEIGIEFVNKVKECYRMERNCHILCQLYMKDFEEPSLYSKIVEVWKKAYEEGRFHLLDGIIYHRTKNTCVMTLKDRGLINTVLHECHDSVIS
ncbi:hypothetical protein O181_039088 [Austropuccinia psidii MF-1]|uniref:Uncharacterized protein n=1 Tax=Austropuccinia psidii MF-1 TaxID=1389203 RepID=A0A9Q3HBM3_9BASI|nr:hypothetical protein [Austropuccinia psidii MF-1]